MAQNLSPAPELRLDLPTEDDTRSFAESLAALVAGTPALSALITLQGDLGAGKTTFCRHLLRALGVTGRIKSPSYAIVEPYLAQPPGGAAPLAVHHFDFYRLGDALEFEEAGLRDLVLAPGLKLVEWPERVAGQMPAPDWALTLKLQPDDSRQAQIIAGTASGARWLDRLRPP
ncbi:tRNA (adenosine(37)-N6)-threonylcarbamoyltransferase complex ATPase subunit type 1 TsaE [Amphibiibacter pelophylacis]|uniref:tRNA (Adenosine(37)-N6)-threonylcarbamoyltransferase complex ATPase subunit type 1 TsaE n=1 Tax=Amphibiibacter pelophylacis TaxID=1799477 RepID=A0ACC6P0Z0_9BURK